MNDISQRVSAIREKMNMAVKDCISKAAATPYPDGAFRSIEQFREWVNTHQQILPDNYRRPDYYSHPNTIEACRNAVFPREAAFVYPVFQGYADSVYVTKWLVPVFDDLVHDAILTCGHDKKPMCVRVWIPEFGKENSFYLRFENLCYVGLFEHTRLGYNYLFSDKTDAEKHREFCLKNQRERPADLDELIAEIDSLCDLLDDD